MEKIDPKRSLFVTCASQLAGVAFRTVCGTVGGAVFGKPVLHLTYKQGAIFGSCLGLILAIAQQAAFTVGINPNLKNRHAIYVLALAVFCSIAVYYRSFISTLLERAEITIAMENLVDFFIASCAHHIFAESISDLFEEQMNAIRADWVVSHLSRGEIQKIIQHIDTYIQKKDLNSSSLIAEMTDALIERLVADEPDVRGLVKIPSDSKEVNDLKDFEVKVLFYRCAIIPESAFDQFIDRLEDLKLFTCPTTPEEIKKMSPPKLKWLLTFYDLVMPVTAKSKVKQRLDVGVWKGFSAV